MSSVQRNIFSVLAQHTLDSTVDANKEQCTELNRLVTLLLDGNDSAVEYILKTSSNRLVHDKDEKGWSLLHYAAEHGRAEAAEMLLEIGACASERDNDQNTPLHIACRSKEAAVAHRLIIYGAEVTARNRYGVTPLNLLGKCRSTQGMLLKRILREPGTVLAFPSRSYFEESLKAFWASRRGVDYEWEQNYNRLVRHNFDDLYLLLCLVQSYGGNFQCIIGNKWNAVDCELSANFQASDAHGSYQATFNTYLQQYLVYYNKTIARLEKQRRKFVRSTTYVVETLANDVSLSKKTSVGTPVATADVLLLNEPRKPLQMFARTAALDKKTVVHAVPLDLSNVLSGFSSSLRASDQTCVNSFDLSVNKRQRKVKSSRPSVQMKERLDLEVNRVGCQQEFSQNTSSGFAKGTQPRECTLEGLTQVSGYTQSNHVASPLTNGFNYSSVPVNGLVQPCSSSAATLVTDDCENVKDKALGSAFVLDNNAFPNGLAGRDDVCMDIDTNVDNMTKLSGSCLVQTGNQDTQEDNACLNVSVTESKEKARSIRESFPFCEDTIGTENCSYDDRFNKETKTCVNGHLRNKKRRAVTDTENRYLFWEKQACAPEVAIVLERNEESQQHWNGCDDVQGQQPPFVVTSSAREACGEGADMQKRLQGMVPRRGAGECMLHVAARCGDMVAVQYLLCRSTSVNTKDHAGWTPLHEAVREGHINVAEVLIRNGADVNAGSSDGTRPLHDAAASNDVRTVRMLLACGAVATAENYSGETAYGLTSSVQVQRTLQEFSSFVVPGARKICGDEDSKTVPALLCGQYSYGPVFEMWDRPPPVLFSLSLCEEESNRYRSYFLLPDVLHFLDMNEASFATRFPAIEPISISCALFSSQVSHLLVSHSGVVPDFSGATSEEIKLVEYSNQLRQALGVDVQVLE